MKSARPVWRLIAFLLAGFMVLTSQSAEARKVALVIANSDYENTSSLPNPVSDADLVASAAKKAGFDQVTRIDNADMDAFVAALRSFASAADGADVAMVYYAGHGLEGKGRNWLLPVDVKLDSERDLPYEAIELGLVMEALAGAQVRMVVLDACRNNPFANRWKSSTRAVTRGLIPVEADDVIVIYAAAPGRVAYDGAGGNSPFARSLAKRLPQADLPLQLLGGAVRDDVLAETGGEQRPFVSASVTGTPIYLVPRSQAGNVSPVPREIRFTVENIVIHCVKNTSGFFGKDELYVLVNTGDRIPEEPGSKHKIGKGDSWVIKRSFSSVAPIGLTLMEADMISDDDNLGTVHTGTTEGHFTRTLRHDSGEYQISFDLRLDG